MEVEERKEEKSVKLCRQASLVDTACYGSWVGIVYDCAITNTIRIA